MSLGTTGQNAQVAHSPTGSTYTTIANVTDVSFTPKQTNDVEDSTFDDAADTFIPGSYTSALSFDLKYVSGATGLSAIFDSIENNTVLYWRVRPTTGSGEKQYVVQGYVSQIVRNAARNSAQMVSVTVRTTGAVTPSNQ